MDICPRCGAPASRPFSQIYCSKCDTQPMARVLVPSGELWKVCTSDLAQLVGAFHAGVQCHADRSAAAQVARSSGRRLFRVTFEAQMTVKPRPEWGLVQVWGTLRSAVEEEP